MQNWKEGLGRKGFPLRFVRDVLDVTGMGDYVWHIVGIQVIMPYQPLPVLSDRF